MAEDVVTNLLKKAIEARANAYAPYSKFRVGAALLCEDGTVFTGCNIENGINNLGICAERVTLAKALSEGHRKFTAIAISSDLEELLCPPCGACLQFMIEFREMDIYLVRPDQSKHQKTKLTDLLPQAFTHDMIEEDPFKQSKK